MFNHIGILIEVFMIASSEPHSQPTMQIHHSSDPIETESIQTVFIDEPSQIGQKESLNLILAIVEHLAVP